MNYKSEQLLREYIRAYIDKCLKEGNDAGTADLDKWVADLGTTMKANKDAKKEKRNSNKEEADAVNNVKMGLINTQLQLTITSARQDKLAGDTRFLNNSVDQKNKSKNYDKIEKTAKELSTEEDKLKRAQLYRDLSRSAGSISSSENYSNNERAVEEIADDNKEAAAGTKQVAKSLDGPMKALTTLSTAIHSRQ